MKSLLLCLTLLLAGWMPAAARDDIVVIDFQAIFQEYRELREADERFREQVRTFQEERAERVQALRDKRELFGRLRQQAADPATSTEERADLAARATELLEELQTEEQTLQQEQQQFQEELQAGMNRLRQRILKQVRDKVSELAEERSWGLVLDRSAKSANGLNIVQHVPPDMDATREVLEALNQDAGTDDEE